MKSIAWFLLVVTALASPCRAIIPATKHIPGEDGDTVAVIVAKEAPLLHTKQLYSSDVTATLGELDRLMTSIVRLNVAARDRAACDIAREAIRKHYPPQHRPAVSFVVGELPQKDATVAIDAVGTVGASEGPGILPPGLRVYISGQAEKAATPAEATARTLASLKETLAFVGSRPADVVQAKCFLTPMSAAPQVEAEFAKAFGEHKVPLVFVEWKSNLPIEIELIAAAPPPSNAETPAIEYLTPPGKTASPLFARVVRVNGADLIFTRGLTSTKPGNGEEQVLSTFSKLQETLKESGGNLRHLVKATYYVSDEDASKQLNVLRPKFYDPARPPAASKAMVPAVSAAERSIAMDFIAVRVPPAKP